MITNCVFRTICNNKQKAKKVVYEYICQNYYHIILLLFFFKLEKKNVTSTGIVLFDPSYKRGQHWVPKTQLYLRNIALQSLSSSAPCSSNGTYYIFRMRAPNIGVLYSAPSKVNATGKHHVTSISTYLPFCGRERLRSQVSSAPLGMVLPAMLQAMQT